MKSFNKVTVIVKGTSGSGKSTFAQYIKNLYAGEDAVICCADNYFYEKYGYYNWNAAELGDAHEYCRNKFLNALKDECKLIVVANTCTREKEFSFYSDSANDHGYVVFHLICENRHHGKSVHNVPESILIKQEAQIKTSLKLR